MTSHRLIVLTQLQNSPTPTAKSYAFESSNISFDTSTIQHTRPQAPAASN